MGRRGERGSAAKQLHRQTEFSYRCGQCGLCCRNKVITLSPYDVFRMTSAGVEPSEVIGRYTIRRGSLLKFNEGGACVALDGNRCTLHNGRPLACRLYPLGLEVNAGDERFVYLEPAPGSAGVYGTDATIADFIEAQGIEPYLAAVSRYAELLDVFRRRLSELVDYERTEPREFRRRAIRDALAESNFDSNPLIDALYDCKRLHDGDEVTAITRHITEMHVLIEHESNADLVAGAAVLLAVSIGRSPDDAFPLELGNQNKTSGGFVETNFSS